MVLADLYDADQRNRNAEVRHTAGTDRIPPPRPRVQDADGTAPASAGREVHSPWINEKES